VPCGCARTDAGGAIGGEALDAGTVASGARIKPGQPGEAFATASRSMPPTCCAPRRAVPLRARTDAGGAIGRDALD
jgi:hypothetical protein